MFGSRCAQHPHGIRKASEFQSAEARERRGVGCKWSSAEGCQIRMKRDLIIYSNNISTVIITFSKHLRVSRRIMKCHIMIPRYWYECFVNRHHHHHHHHQQQQQQQQHHHLHCHDHNHDHYCVMFLCRCRHVEPVDFTSCWVSKSMRDGTENDNRLRSSPFGSDSPSALGHSGFGWPLDPFDVVWCGMMTYDYPTVYDRTIWDYSRKARNTMIISFWYYVYSIYTHISESDVKFSPPNSLPVAWWTRLLLMGGLIPLILDSAKLVHIDNTWSAPFQPSYGMNR